MHRFYIRYVAVDAMLNLRRREVEIMFEKRYSGTKDSPTFVLDSLSIILSLEF